MPKNPNSDRAARRSMQLQRRAENDKRTNRILLTFCLCLLSLGGLYAAYSYSNRVATILTVRTVMWVLGAVAAAGAVTAASVGLYLRKSGKSTGLSGYFTGVFLLLAVSCVLIAAFHNTAFSFLYVLIPGVSILYLIYFAYQREFFVNALVSGVGGLGLWVLSKFYAESYGLWLLLAGAVLVVLAAVAAVVLRHNGGRFRFGRLYWHVLPRNAGYSLLFIMLGLIALALLLTLIFGIMAAYYSVFGIFAALFVIAVYYTVKLM